MIIDMENLVNLHVKKFGKRPKFTGFYFHEPETLLMELYNSIQMDQPYVEPEVPEGIDI